MLRRVFYVFEGVKGSKGQRTCKTRHLGAFYMYEGKGMGQRGGDGSEGDEHIKHTRLGVFYVLEGRGGSVGRQTHKTRPSGRVLRV